MITSYVGLPSWNALEKSPSSSIMGYLNVADQQRDEVGDIGVDSKRNNKDNGEHRVECGKFDGHHGGGLICTDMLSSEGILHIHSEEKEMASNEESVEEGWFDLEAEIYKLEVAIIKDCTADFGKDKNGHGY